MIRGRLLCLVAPLVSLGLLSGCGAASPAAATVGGHDITRHDLNQDLAAISDNKPLRAEPSIQVASTPKGTLSSSVTASWLAGLVQQVVFDREFARLHLRVTADDRAAARASLEQQFTAKIFNGFSKGFRDRAIERQARIRALVQAVTQGAQSQADLNQRFTQLLERGLRRGNVHVDPRYGKPELTAQGFQIVPPSPPKVREKPGPAATSAPVGIPGG